MFRKLKYIFLSLLLVPVFSLGFLGQKEEKSALLHRNLMKNSPESTEFINYWFDDFRLDEQGEIISICDITYSSYKEMYGKYTLLSDPSREIVDATADYEEGYTIKDSIKELVDLYENVPSPVNRKPTLNHSSTIIIVVVVAVFGMSVICVFFALKNGNLIK